MRLVVMIRVSNLSIVETAPPSALKGISYFVLSTPDVSILTPKSKCKIKVLKPLVDFF